MKIEDILNIEYILPIIDSDKLNESINDLGKLHEGFCFKIFTVFQNKDFENKNIKKISNNEEKHVNWIFCLDSEENKQNLIKNLIKLKVENQQFRLNNLELKKPEAINTTNILNLSNNVNKREEKLNKKKNLKFKNITNKTTDGYWVIIKDWGECSLKCNGGKQYQHLLCVPPKNNGLKCEGESIREKSCNLEPCPKVIPEDFFLTNQTINDLINQNFFENVEITNPLISNRPKHYDKCHIKESDAIWLKNIGNKEHAVPVSLILNDKTFSVYIYDVNINNKLF